MAENENTEISTERVIRLATEAEGYIELELYDRALAKADLLIGSKAGLHAGLALKTDIFRRMERYEEALPLLEDASRLFPEDEAIWVNIGWCRKRTDRLDLAIKAMEDLLTNSPQSPIGHFNMACYLSLSGDKTGALAYLKRALELDSSFMDAVEGEKDLDPIRDEQAFKELLGE